MGIPTREELRQTLVLRCGEGLLAKFEQASVAVCGLGGLGSNIAIALARAGVGKLHLIDFDSVDITNLNRQQYSVNQLGMPKTEALKDTLLNIAPYCDIITDSVKITEENGAGLLKNDDIICEALDNAESKAMLTNLVCEQFPEKYLVAASGMAGLHSPNSIRTRKITPHFFLCGDGSSDVETDGSLFSARAMLCAAHQALAVLRIIAGETDT